MTAVGTPDEDLSVSELASRLRLTLQRAFPRPFWVTGEVSSFKKSGSRLYLELVERPAPLAPPSASLPAIVQGQAVELLRQKMKEHKIKLVDGTRLRVLVRCSMYAPRGSLQLEVVDIDPVYTLEQAAVSREEIIARLRTEGLLDRQRTNHVLPRPALRVALLTAPGSHAQADFVQQLGSSPFAFEVTTNPIVVQGSQAVPSIVQALARLSTPQAQNAFDVVCLVRGGGSRSDLAAWDDVELARTVALFPLPVLSGIGHELDHSVVDEVVLLAAKTPTALAQFLIDEAQGCWDVVDAAFGRFHTLATSRVQGLLGALGSSESRLTTAVSRRVVSEEHLLAEVPKRISRLASRPLALAEARLQDVLPRIAAVALRSVDQKTLALDSTDALLRSLSLDATLDRGFSITRRLDGSLLRSSDGVVTGEVLVTSLSSGTVHSTALEHHAASDEKGSAHGQTTR